MPNYNARFILENIGDTAALSAYPEPVPGLPASYLQLQERSYAMRSTSGAAQAILGNLVSARQASSDGVALFGTFSNEATLRIRLYAGLTQTGALVYDSTALEVSPKGGAWYHFFEAASGTYLSFRIDLTDPSPLNGYHELFRLVLGGVLTPDINFQYGYDYAIEDDTETVRDAAGGLHSSPGAQYRTFNISFEEIPESQRGLFHDAFTWVGKVRDFFACLRPDNDRPYDFALLAKFTQMPKIGNPYWESYSIPFELSETIGGYGGVTTTQSVPSGGGGIGALNSEWRLVIDGLAPLTSAQPIASNGAGVALIAYQGRTFMRSADHGLTWLPEELPYQDAISDVKWSGNYFLACGYEGGIYYSVDGVMSYSRLNQVGHRLDVVAPWDDGYYLAAGEKVYLGNHLLSTLEDVSVDSGWSLLTNPIAAASVRTGLTSGLLFPAHAGLIVAEYDTGVWSYWTATGLTGNWVRAFAAWDGRVLAQTDANKLYLSQDYGRSFSEVYAPPANYLIHDTIVVAGPFLVVSMAGPGGDRMLAISPTATSGSFSEYRISAPVRSSQYSRLAFTGKRAVLTDAGAIRTSGSV